jgi:glutathione peroxidase
MRTLHDFSATTIDGKEQSLRDYAGKVALVVNVASQCGLTPHYGGLEELYKEYKDRGLVVLGFPCNQFGGQEPGTEGEIKTFCETALRRDVPDVLEGRRERAEAPSVYEFLTAAQSAPDGPATSSGTSPSSSSIAPATSSRASGRDGAGLRGGLGALEKQLG